MISIEYPVFDFRIKKGIEKELIFDEFRKQWVRLTPEEWVRQNMLQYLVQVKKYPASLIAVEKEITVGELKKRFDILVYRNAKPWMVIECKEINVALTETALKQVLNYNITLQTPFIIISNGIGIVGFSLQKGTLEKLSAFPDF